MGYIESIEPYYVDSLQDAAHYLATPALCYGIPCVYFALTMAGYQDMRSRQTGFTPPDWFKSVYNLAQVRIV